MLLLSSIILTSLSLCAAALPSGSSSKRALLFNQLPKGLNTNLECKGSGLDYTVETSSLSEFFPNEEFAWVTVKAAQLSAAEIGDCSSKRGKPETQWIQLDVMYDLTERIQGALRFTGILNTDSTVTYCSSELQWTTDPVWPKKAAPLMCSQAKESQSQTISLASVWPSTAADFQISSVKCAGHTQFDLNKMKHWLIDSSDQPGDQKAQWIQSSSSNAVSSEKLGACQPTEKLQSFSLLVALPKHKGSLQVWALGESGTQKMTKLCSVELLGPQGAVSKCATNKVSNT